MLPEEGGYYRWVDRAFGRFWAFSNGGPYVFVDMAIYPVLFNQYLRYFIPGLDARVEWVISLAMIWSATWINVRGSVNVTRVSIIAGLFSCSASRIVSRERAAHSGTFRGNRSRRSTLTTRRFGRRHLDCALELYRLDNPSTAQARLRSFEHVSRALAFTAAACHDRLLRSIAHHARCKRWTTWTQGGGRRSRFRC